MLETLGAAIPKGWKRGKLGEICKHGGGSIQTGPFGSQLHAEDYKEEGIPIITVEHLGDNKIFHSNLPLVGDSDYQRLSKYTLQLGDLVFSRVGAIDRCAYVSSDENGWLFSGRCLRVRPGNCFNAKFLSYQLNSLPCRRWILNNSVGSTMACLNTSILSNLPVLVPTIAEQKQIAEILDTLGKTIANTEALIAKLKQMKAGLLHDLLTRGLDENGKLRDAIEHPEQFKDSPLGQIPKDWNVFQLFELVPKAEYGISVSLEDEHGIPVLRMNNLKDGEINLSDLKNSASPKAASLLLQPLDVLFNRTNSIEHVGRASVWRGQLERASFASYLVRLVPDASKLIPEYLNLWLNLPSIQILIRRYATPGVHQVNINPTNLRKVLIALPIKVIEQKAIVDKVSAHDARIQLEKAYLNKLKEQKKGLMHDLLTGRVRVHTL